MRINPRASLKQQRIQIKGVAVRLERFFQIRLKLGKLLRHFRQMRAPKHDRKAFRADKIAVEVIHRKIRTSQNLLLQFAQIFGRELIRELLVIHELESGVASSSSAGGGEINCIISALQGC